MESQEWQGCRQKGWRPGHRTGEVFSHQGMLELLSKELTAEVPRLMAAVLPAS